MAKKNKKRLSLKEIAELVINNPFANVEVAFND